MKKIFFLTTLVVVSMIFYSPAFSQVIKGTYAIKNMETGMLLRIQDANKKNGTPLVSYSPVNWKCMTWDFKHLEGKTYQLKNLFTGKTFQPNAEGIGLEQQPLVAEATNQQYEFVPVKENIYEIKLKGTNLFVTPSDKNGATNSEIILSKKTNSKLQQWTIYEQHPDM